MSQLTDSGEWQRSTAAFTSVNESRYAYGDHQFNLPAGTQLVVDTDGIKPKVGDTIYVIEPRQALEPMSSSRNVDPIQIRLM